MKPCSIPSEYKTLNFTEVSLRPSFTYNYLKQVKTWDVDFQSSLIVTQTHKGLHDCYSST